jgi:hypothetical protein
MLMRDHVSFFGTGTDLPRKIRALYGRCRPYVEHGLGHFLMYVFGRFRLVRSFMVWIYSQKVSKQSSASGRSLIEDVDVDHAVARIRRDGIFSGLNLRSEVVEEFLKASSESTCFGDGNVDFPFRYGSGDFSQQQAAQTFRLGTYNNGLCRLPPLRLLPLTPQLLAIARQYLGTQPALIGARMWWSFVCPADNKQQVKPDQGLQYDIDAYRGLTFSFT